MTTLYFVEFQFQDFTYYKIGVTNRESVQKRLIGIKIKVLFTRYFETPEEARFVESFMLTKYDQYRYKGKEQLLKYNEGITEVFTSNILEHPVAQKEFLETEPVIPKRTGLKVINHLYIPGHLLREARNQYQKGHLLDPDKRDRITEVIASKIDVKPETLYKMERDQYTMKLWQLKRLADIYRISLVFDDENNITVEVNRND